MKQPVTPERFAELGRRKKLKVASKKRVPLISSPRRTTGTLWSHLASDGSIYFTGRYGNKRVLVEPASAGSTNISPGWKFYLWPKPLENEFQRAVEVVRTRTKCIGGCHHGRADRNG